MIALLKDVAKSMAMFALYLVRKAQVSWHGLGTPPLPHQPDVLFSTSEKFRRTYLHTNGDLVTADVLIGELADKLKRSHTVAWLDISTFERSSGNRTERLAQAPSWSLLEQHVSLADLLRSLWWTVLLLCRNENMEREVRLHGIDGCAQSTYQHAISHLTAHRILDAVQPRAVFMVAEYVYIQRALCRVARQRKIPVFALQHGVFSEFAPAYVFSPEEGPVLADQLPDHMLVWSELFRGYLLKHARGGFKPSNVFVVGNPRFDIFARSDQLYSREQTRASHGIPAGQKMVLWTTALHEWTLPPERRLRELSAMADCARRMPTVTFVIKQHPSEPSGCARLLRRTMALPQPNILVTPKSVDTNALIYSCDLMVAGSSTTTAEAVSFGRPVITMELDNQLGTVSTYAQTGATSDVRSADDLGPTIERLLADDSEQAAGRDRFIETYYFRNDGGATQRVVDHVHSVLTEQEPRAFQAASTTDSAGR